MRTDVRRVRSVGRSAIASRSVARSLGRSVGRVVDPPVGRSVGPPVGRSVGPSVRRSVGRSDGRSVARSLGRSVARSLGQLVARSLGRLVARSLGRSFEGNCCRGICFVSLSSFFASQRVSVMYMSILIHPHVFARESNKKRNTNSIEQKL